MIRGYDSVEWILQHVHRDCRMNGKIAVVKVNGLHMNGLHRNGLHQIVANDHRPCIHFSTGCYGKQRPCNQFGNQSAAKQMYSVLRVLGQYASFRAERS